MFLEFFSLNGKGKRNDQHACIAEERCVCTCELLAFALSRHGSCNSLGVCFEIEFNQNFVWKCQHAQDIKPPNHKKPQKRPSRVHEILFTFYGVLPWPQGGVAPMCGRQAVGVALLHLAQLSRAVLIGGNGRRGGLERRHLAGNFVTVKK